MRNRLTDTERRQHMAEIVTMLAALTDLVRPARTSSASMERMLVAYAEALADFDLEVVRDAIRRWPLEHKTWPSLAELRKLCMPAVESLPSNIDPSLKNKLDALHQRGWSAAKISTMPSSVSAWIVENLRDRSVDELAEGLLRADATGVPPARRRRLESLEGIDDAENLNLAKEIARDPSSFAHAPLLLRIYLSMCAKALDRDRLARVHRELLACASDGTKETIAHAIAKNFTVA